MKVSFFGHKDTPKEIEPTLRTALVDLIEGFGVTEFYVGNNGNFDIMVRRQLEDLSHSYTLDYYVVLAYLPVKNSEHKDSINTIFPEGIEAVPKRFAISFRNKWMIQHSDVVVTFVTRNFGGAWQFKKMAERLGKVVIELN